MILLIFTIFGAIEYKKQMLSESLTKFPIKGELMITEWS